MEQRERRIGERRNRHDRQPQQPADRARHVRADHRRVAQRAHRHAVAQAHAGDDRLDLEQRPAVGRARLGHHVFVGHRRARGERSVDLEAAAHHDVLEVAGARGRAHRRDRAQLGALDRATPGSCATRARRRRSARRRSARSLRRTPRAGRGRGDRCGGTPRGGAGGAAARSRRRPPRRPTGAARSAARRGCRARRPFP